MTHFILRDYQLDAIERVRASWRAGHKRIVIVAPCGSGKTTIAAALIESAIKKGSRCLMLAHRAELVTQAVDRLDSIGIDSGIVMADHPRWKPWAMVQVASVPTLIRRLGNRPQAQLVIQDECHHSLAPSFAKVLSAYPEAAIIGLSATPWRDTDGRGLHEIFDDMIVVAQPRELVDHGHLIAPRVFAPDKPNLTRIKIRGDDYDVNELEARLNTRRLVGRVVGEWQRIANGLPTIVFAVNIKHSMALRDRFIEAGVRAEHLDGETPGDERMATLKRLRDGATTVLINVGIASEGFDCPQLSCVQLCRPTTSTALHLQQIGRIMRPYPGKTQAIVIDHADNTRKHGLPLEDREYTLADIEKPPRGSKPDPDRAKVCHSCQAAVPMSARICPECGAAFGENKPSPEETDHELKEWGVSVCKSCGSSDLRPIQNTEKFGELRALIVCQACGDTRWATSKLAKRATPEQKQKEFARLEAVRVAKGFQKGWTWHQFKAKFGVWPSRYA